MKGHEEDLGLRDSGEWQEEETGKMKKRQVEGTKERGEREQNEKRFGRLSYIVQQQERRGFPTQQSNCTLHTAH